jgi:glycosyltransferase involved in cell wall biosynthesis
MDKKKLDVLMISASYEPQTGGVASHVKYLTEALTRVTKSRVNLTKVCRVVVLTGSGRPQAEGTPEKTRFYTVYRTPFDLKIDGEPFSSAGSAPLARQIEFAQKNWSKIIPDVIHAHDLEIAYIGWMLKIAYGIPLVVTIHKAPKEWDATSTQRDPKNCFLEAMLVGGWADRLIAPSSAYKARLLNQNFTPDKVTKILHGVPVKWLASQGNREVFRRFRLHPNDKFLLCPTRLDPHKGVEILIEAAKILNDRPEGRDLLYVIAGGGTDEYKNDIAASLNGSGIESRVRLGPDGGGNCTLSEMASLYKAALACVLPSLREGFGQAILEAYVFKTPVVASNTGGIPDVVIPDKTGLLFNRGEARDLVHQLERILNDKLLAKTIADSALQTVQEEFSAQRMAYDYFHMYREVAQIRIV